MLKMTMKLLLTAAGAAMIVASPALANEIWTATWSTSQQIAEGNNALPAADLTDATMRQIVHTSIAGTSLRLRLSNTFGTTPLTLRGVHVAMAPSTTAPTIDASTDHAVTFGGQSDITIPAGAEFLSDPVAMALPVGSNLAISFYIPTPPVQQTTHAGSRATSYLVHGNHVADADLSEPKRFDHWYHIAAIDVTAAPGAGAGAIAIIGDSITDGHGVTTNGNDRWTDVLAQRLNAAGIKLGILNEGIGGGRILNDGLGPNALARFNRDVVIQSGVKYVIVLEGINDLGVLTRDAPVTPEAHSAFVAQLEAGYSQMISEAHLHGLTIIGATVMPYAGSDYYHPDAQNEADRQAVNAWIRAPGHFDAVIDFDAAMRDPQHTDRLNPAYDLGDHLHPSPAGYKAMGEAVPLSLFAAMSTPAKTKTPVVRHRRGR